MRPKKNWQFGIALPVGNTCAPVIEKITRFHGLPVIITVTVKVMVTGTVVITVTVEVTLTVRITATVTVNITVKVIARATALQRQL